jgi:hypothetical protein
MDPEPCEACGQDVYQLQLNQDGELTGPWYEQRTHQRGNATHRWYQPHNCIHPNPTGASSAPSTTSTAGRGRPSRPIS